MNTPKISETIVVFAALATAGVGLIVLPAQLPAFASDAGALQPVGMALFAAGLAYFLIRMAGQGRQAQAVTLFAALTTAGVGLIVSPAYILLPAAAATLPLAGAALITAALTFFLVRMTRS